MSKRNKVQLVVADLAGTTVDFGSRAPAGAFVRLFERHGIVATPAQAREPMGMNKRDHIKAMLENPDIAAQWRRKNGTSYSEADLDALYAEFIPLQLECLPDYGDVIPGVVETVAQLRARGIAVAVTTGYNRDMLEVVLDCAKKGGFCPDAAFCASDVASGRPAPYMLFRAMEALNIHDIASIIAIGDTIPDISAGLNGGMWTVGVVNTGNMVGLSQAEWEALPVGEQEQRKTVTRQVYNTARAHFVVDSFAACLSVIAAIESQTGCTPGLSTTCIGEP